MAAPAFVPLYTLLSTFNAKPIIRQTVFSQRDRFRLLDTKRCKKKIRAWRIIQRIYSDFETVFYKFFFFQKGNWISLDEKEHFIALVSAMNFVVIFERRLYFTRCTLNFEDYHQSCQNNLWKEWMEVVSELIIGPFASI